MPIYQDGKKMKPYRGYRKPVNVYYGDKKVAGWKNSTQTGNNLTFRTTYNDTADVVVKGKTLQKSEWVHKQGLTTQDSFAVNDEITVPYREYNLIFRIVHINGELLTIEMKNVFSNLYAYRAVQFDGAEALYFAEEGLAAGTYNFTLLAGYEVAYGGGKTYQFTLTQNVPAGGCLMFPWGPQVQAVTVKISSYASLTATTAIESVSVTEGASGTNLGTADGNTPNMNHAHRIRYGSDNYAQSAIRQWLNSSAALGSVWVPKTKFDRPPSWHTSSDPTYAGFMNGLDPDFLAIIEPTTIPCRTNSIFEVNSLDGTTFTTNQVYTVQDKFFILSRPEIFGDWDSASYKDGELLEFYDGLTQTERIKYDAFGTVRNAWLRSPDPSRASYPRFVDVAGLLHRGYATSALGVVAACNVKISNLQTLIDTGTISYTHANPSPLYPQPLVSNLPAGTYKVADYKGDWWEFTLTENLHGIGDVRDSVEWDKYGHKGFESRKIGQILSYTDEIIETAYMSTTGGLDTGAHICYVLATPTRTPLIFTKNNASTAPECPMEFLTDTPSLEYPAEVFDAQGTITSRNADDTQSVTATIPPLRKIGDVADSYNPETGEYVQRIGKLILTGNEPQVATADNNTVNPDLLSFIIRFTPKIAVVNSPVLCTHFIEVKDPHYTHRTIENISGYVDTSADFVGSVLKSRLITVDTEGFKAFLAAQYAAGTPVTVYYQLAEPVVTYLDPATLPTYYPTTVITTANDTPAELETTASVKVEDD